MFIVAVAIFFGLVASGLAWNRGLSPSKWMVAGFLLGPFSLAVTFLPRSVKTKVKVIPCDPPRRKCGRCGSFIDDEEPEPCSSCRDEILLSLGYDLRPRIWTICGSPTTARLVFIDGEFIEIRKPDGTLLKLARSDLSFDDLSYLDLDCKSLPE